MLTALFALFVFTGDLAADAICEATGACLTEKQGSDQDGDCPACACSMHSGSVVPMEATAQAPACAMEVEQMLAVVDGAAPDGVRAAIDLPPQLA